MTTITIENTNHINQHHFADVNELFQYLLETGELTLLEPYTEPLTDQQKKRIKQALSTPKSQMVNL